MYFTLLIDVQKIIIITVTGFTMLVDTMSLNKISSYTYKTEKKFILGNFNK